MGSQSTFAKKLRISGVHGSHLTHRHCRLAQSVRIASYRSYYHLLFFDFPFELIYIPKKFFVLFFRKFKNPIDNVRPLCDNRAIKLLLNGINQIIYRYIKGGYLLCNRSY